MGMEDAGIGPACGCSPSVQKHPVCERRMAARMSRGDQTRHGLPRVLRGYMQGVHAEARMGQVDCSQGACCRKDQQMVHSEGRISGACSVRHVRHVWHVRRQHRASSEGFVFQLGLQLWQQRVGGRDVQAFFGVDQPTVAVPVLNHTLNRCDGVGLTFACPNHGE